MNKINKILYNEKKKIDDIQAPMEMESVIRNTLEKKNIPKVKPRHRLRTAAALLVIFILIGYNINTLAYYSKKFMGFDNVMNSTLQNLNELGKGQTINQTITLQDNIQITLDGVMLDDNNFIVFYTIDAPNGNVDEISDHISVSLSGITGDIIPNHGIGEMNKDNTQIKWMSYYETPLFFVNKITFHSQYMDNNSVVETSQITFRLDRNKAMGHTLEKKINKSFEIQEGDIKVKKIIASPTSTELEGNIQNSFELGIDQITGERLRPVELDIKLLANGKELPRQGSEMQTNLNGITFSISYDILPKELKTLQMKLATFSVDHDVQEQVRVRIGESNPSINILNNQINILEVHEKDGQTLVTISTEESTLLSKVHLQSDNTIIPLEQTISEELIKEEDGRIIKERTLVFDGTGKSLDMMIESITYVKTYDDIINIELD